RPRRSQPAAPVDTPTYATFYGLNEKPFSLSSDPRFLYHSASHDRATQKMLGAIRRREAMVVLTGEIGVGKTTLCRGVIEQLDRHTFTSFVVDPFESAEDLLKTVLVDFGVISRDDLARGRLTNASRADLAAVLRDFLFSLAPLQAFAVVFIDEAQNLPVDLLAQMRVLADTEGDARLLQVVLVGQPSLLTTLARPELRQLAQRISIRCTLEPLAGDEVAGYVMNRLAIAGGGLRVEFGDGSLECVYELSAGVPRVVNLLCDRALSVGYGLSASVIDARIVEAAAEDLDLDPPMSGASAARITAAIVALMLLVLLGAAGAAYVFRARLSAVVTEWQAAPQPPPGPHLALPVPYAPMPAVDAEKLPSSA
ncbi:MAG: AAA family ATPase, partial [Acidobacteria bacterium]|nr:AAA family ATPase [Acidobacteriota bacterium]